MLARTPPRLELRRSCLSVLCFDCLVSIRDLKLGKLTNVAFGLELSEPERLTNNI